MAMYAQPEEIRSVILPLGSKTFTMKLFDMHNTLSGKPRVRVEVRSPNGKLRVRFDMGMGPMHGIDSDDAVKTALVFLANAGEDDTPAQQSFSRTYGEECSWLEHSYGWRDSDPEYTAEDCGCFADGAMGDEHVRETLSDLSGVEVSECPETGQWENEDEALSALQARTAEGLEWVVDGDLLLRPTEEGRTA